MNEEKMNVDLEGMKTLYSTAKRGGKFELWAELALEWMTEANKHIQVLESQIEDAQKMAEELENRLNENL